MFFHRVCTVRPSQGCRRHFAQEALGPSYAVIGGGISGLSMAYFLMKRKPSARVTLFELTDRVGGWIKTDHAALSNGRDIILEKGPRSLRTRGSGQATLQLLKQIGLENSIIPASAASSRRRFLYFDGLMHEIPGGSWGAWFSPTSLKLIGAMLREPFRPSRRHGGDESVYDFFDRRLGRFGAEKIASALMLGIYAGDSKKLSIEATLPSISTLERERGSIVKGMMSSWAKPTQELEADIVANQKVQEALSVGLYSFQQGLEQLPLHILRSLQQSDGFQLRLECPIEELCFDKNSVTLSGQWNGCADSQSFDHVVCTAPSFATAKIVQASCPTLSELLYSIQYADVAVLNVVVSTCDLPGGFGYLVPPCEKQPILGVVFDSQSFPSIYKDHGNAHHCLTAMMGGTTNQNLNLISVSSEELIEIGVDAMVRHLGITPSAVQATYCSRHASAIPQPQVGHCDKVKSIRDNSPPTITICGNFMDGVGVNDCIAASERISQKI